MSNDSVSLSLVQKNLFAEVFTMFSFNFFPLIIIFLCNSSNQSLIKVEPLSFDIKYNKNCLNFNTDKPEKSDVFGRITINIFKDITNAFVSFYFVITFEILNNILKLNAIVIAKTSEKILVNSTLSLCRRRKFQNQNFFVRHLLPHITDNIDFQLKCPFKKVVEKISNCEKFQ